MLSWFRKKMKLIMIVVAVLFAASMFYGLSYRGLKGGFGGGTASNIIARINGREVDPLRYQELINRVAQNFGPNASPSDMSLIDSLALNQAIDFTLLQQEAEKRVKVSGGEIDAALDSVMKQQNVPSKRALEETLKRMGLTLGRFRDFIKGDIEVQKLQMKLAEEIRVTPDDLREVRASHILVSTEVEAKALLSKLRLGADFAALAKEYSKDPGSAAKGGDLGYFTTGSMVEQFEKAAFSLKPGETSGIIRTPFGYHILKVTDARLRKFKVNDQEIEKEVLREKQQNAFRRFYAEIRSKARIEIVNPILRGHDFRFKGHLFEAIAEYQKAIAQTPTNPFIHIYLGDAYLASGRKDLAIAEYENAVKVEGGNPDLYLVLGRAYAGMGEKTLAAEQFRKASLIAGDSKEMHEKLLKLFQQMKRPAEAAHEQAELKRLEKKEKFEKEITGGK